MERRGGRRFSTLLGAPSGQCASVLHPGEPYAGNQRPVRIIDARRSRASIAGAFACHRCPDGIGCDVPVPSGEECTAYVGVNNALNTTAVVAMRPAGLRPNMPRLLRPASALRCKDQANCFRRCTSRRMSSIPLRFARRAKKNFPRHAESNTGWSHGWGRTARISPHSTPIATS